MSWKPALSRHLRVLRFFACPESPSGRGVYAFFQKNQEELQYLNPSLPILLRSADNCLPAVTTELQFTTDDLLKFCIQTEKFRDTNGTISEARVEAAKAYMQTDWELLRRERWNSPGFDPEMPYLEEENPRWREEPKIAKDLSVFLKAKDVMEEQKSVFESGPGNEFERAKNSLLMMQRVDLWCAGEKETEAAVRHLVMLGQRFNALEPDPPESIAEFYPGVENL